MCIYRHVMYQNPIEAINTKTQKEAKDRKIELTYMGQLFLNTIETICIVTLHVDYSLSRLLLKFQRN